MGSSDGLENIYWVPRFADLAVLRQDVDSAVDSALLAAASRYDIATGQTAMMSHVRGLTPAHKISVIPTRHLPSVRDIPCD